MSNDQANGNTAYLSKSLFVRGVRCHKSLYLSKYKPELKDEVSADTEKRFEAGYEIGDLAQTLFPGGVLVPYEGLSHEEQIKMTTDLIAQGCRTIYEATFFYNDVFIKADILHQGDNGWNVYEVKSSTEVKDYHYYDAAVQYYVIAGTGLPVSKAFIVHINNQYIRQGAIEVNKLFHKEDITAIVKEKQMFIIEEIERQRVMLNGNEPAINIGPQCEEFYPCDFKGNCWSHIPENSLFDIKGRFDARFRLYNNGIISMYDVSKDNLSEKQIIQVDAARTHDARCDQNAIKEFVNSLWYPLYFLDFETFTQAIPPYGGIRPYQQIPFQYSLHYLEHKGDDLKHYEFLAMPHIDPRKELIEKLVKEIPDNACVLVYNKSFEIGRMQELAGSFPEHAEKIEKIIQNIRDLMVLFRGYDIYYWQQGGSYSLKAVLPVMVPEFSYDQLDVQNGGMAMDAYAAMNQTDDHKKIAKIRQSLLKYCKLDTLAMVKILERLQTYTMNTP